MAESCRLRCEKQGIPFYRFNPQFDEDDPIIASNETERKNLYLLISKAQSCLNSHWEVPICRLANLLERVEKGRTQTHGYDFSSVAKTSL